MAALAAGVTHVVRPRGTRQIRTHRGAAVAAKCCTTRRESVAKRYRFPFARL
jgi:hypothetical protein